MDAARIRPIHIRPARYYPPRTRQEGDAFLSFLTNFMYICRDGRWGVQSYERYREGPLKTIVGVNFDGHLSDRAV